MHSLRLAIAESEIRIALHKKASHCDLRGKIRSRQMTMRHERKPTRSIEPVNLFCELNLSSPLKGFDQPKTVQTYNYLILHSVFFTIKNR